jgi:hypothetical protein
MKRKCALALLTLCLFPWLACGGHGGGSSPTETKSRLTLGGLVNPVGAGVVQEVRLFLDGKEVAKRDFGAGCTIGCTTSVDIEGVPRGQHTFSLTVTRQTRVSVVYIIVMDGVYVDSSGVPTQIPARTSTLSLREGGTITYNISF